MGKKTIMLVVAFVVVCIGAIAYVQVDQYSQKKQAEAQAEALRQKMEKETKAIIDKGDPLKKALEAHQQQQQKQ